MINNLELRISVHTEVTKVMQRFRLKRFPPKCSYFKRFG